MEGFLSMKEIKGDSIWSWEKIVTTVPCQGFQKGKVALLQDDMVSFLAFNIQYDFTSTFLEKLENTIISHIEVKK